MTRRRHETTMIATTADLRDATPVALPAVDFMPAHPAVGGSKATRAFRWLVGAAAAILRGAMVLVVAANVVGCATTAPAVVHPAPRAQAVSKCMAAEDAGRPAPACVALASDVAALRVLSAMAGR